ncbi:hypothetical protein ESCO_003409 [Escovopsis weberi]|uniref:Uncharacterized protein n=1 Tax=Escovopsis weberi TaxID=150374 RepID=A0A0N0RUA1_ESCWE|nr:hypothetical protein ESCO_003409 [Escovopsis weberi]
MPGPRNLSAGGGSSSTLRARLSSQPPPSHPKLSSSSSSSLACQGQSRDLYQHFRACFVPVPAAPASTHTRAESSSDDSLIVALGESIARDGFKLHSAVVEHLSQAQAQILANIAAFSRASSSALADLDAMYANIACPLAATLCHSAHFPRATLGAHLASMRDRLAAAQGELAALRAEWDDNVRLEERIRRELAVGAPAQQDAGQMEAFKLEAESIAREQTRALDDIEAHYKELMQAKTMEMMQFMLAD